MHERKFANEIVPSTSKDVSLSLPLATHSTVSKPNETIARTIKPPMAENKSEQENKVNRNKNFKKKRSILYFSRQNQRIMKRTIQYHH